MTETTLPVMNAADTNDARHLIEVKVIPGKGKGCFAKARIPRGTRMLADEPLLRAPDGDIESVLSAFSKLTPNQQATYLELHGTSSPAFRESKTIVHYPASSQEIYSIFKMNNFGGGDVYGIGSRINHSCKPNAAHCSPAGKRIFHAMHDIKAGEEISISYIEETMTRARRQFELARLWDFDCSCEHCQDTPENALLEQKRARFAVIDAEIKQTKKDVSGGAERRLALYQEKAGILEALGLHQYDLSECYQELSHRCAQQGNLEMAIAWAEKDLELLSDISGEDDPDFQMAQSECDELALRSLTESGQPQQ